MTFKIGSNNLNTTAAVIDRIMDHPAVCRLTLERGHQSHLLCHQAPLSSSLIILSVALEIPSRSGGAEREPLAAHLNDDSRRELEVISKFDPRFDDLWKPGLSVNSAPCQSAWLAL